MTLTKDDLHDGQLCFLDKEALKTYHQLFHIPGTASKDRAVIFILIAKPRASEDKGLFAPIRKVKESFDPNKWLNYDEPTHMPIFNPLVPIPSCLSSRSTEANSEELRHHCCARGNYILFDFQPMMLINKSTDWSWWGYIDLNSIIEITTSNLDEFYAKELADNRLCECSCDFIQAIAGEVIHDPHFITRSLQFTTPNVPESTQHMSMVLPYKTYWLDSTRAGWNQNNLLRGKDIVSSFCMVISVDAHNPDFVYIVPIANHTYRHTDKSPSNPAGLKLLGIEVDDFKIEVEVTVSLAKRGSSGSTLDLTYKLDFNSCTQVSQDSLLTPPRGSAFYNCHVSDESRSTIDQAFQRYLAKFRTQNEEELTSGSQPAEERRQAQKEKKWLSAQEKYWDDNVRPY